MEVECRGWRVVAVTVVVAAVVAAVMAMKMAGPAGRRMLLQLDRRACREVAAARGDEGVYSIWARRGRSTAAQPVSRRASRWR